MPSFIVEESFNSVKIFWLKQEELIEEIQKLACKLGNEDERVLQIVLFGSLAQRKAVPGSDADILILLKEDKTNFIDRVPVWQEKFSLGFPVEVFPYTEKESNCPMVIEAMTKGTILFQRTKSVPV